MFPADLADSTDFFIHNLKNNLPDLLNLRAKKHSKLCTKALRAKKSQLQRRKVFILFALFLFPADLADLTDFFIHNLKNNLPDLLNMREKKHSELCAKSLRALRLNAAK
ncbi:hypothetical protein LPB89_14920 [Flavobacterium sp. ENC]|nr:hypothetical protein [Flavobacterium sp. ENC]